MKNKNKTMSEFDVDGMCMCKNICPLQSKHRKMITVPNCLLRKRNTCENETTTTTCSWTKKNCSRKQKRNTDKNSIQRAKKKTSERRGRC